jgi:hypothetical protein
MWTSELQMLRDQSDKRLALLRHPKMKKNIVLSSLGVIGSRTPYKPMFVSPLAVNEMPENHSTIEASLCHRTPLTNSQLKTLKNDSGNDELRAENDDEQPVNGTNVTDANGKSVSGGGKVVWNTDLWSRRGSLSARSMDAASLSDRRAVTPEMFVELSAKIADLVMRQEKLERASLQSITLFPAAATAAPVARDVDSRLSNSTQASIAITTTAAMMAAVSAVNSRVDFGVQVDSPLADADTAQPISFGDDDPSTSAYASLPPSQRQPINATDVVCNGSLKLEGQRIEIVSGFDSATEKAQRCARSVDGQVTTSPRVRICETVECIDDRMTTCSTDDDIPDVVIDSRVTTSSKAVGESDFGRIDVGQVIHAVRGSVSLKDVSFECHSVLVELKPLPQPRARSVDSMIEASCDGCENDDKSVAITTCHRMYKEAVYTEGLDTNSAGRRSKGPSFHDSSIDAVRMNETANCQEDNDLTLRHERANHSQRKVFRFDPERRSHQLNLASSVSAAEYGDSPKISSQFRAVTLDDTTKSAATRSHMSRTKSPPIGGAMQCSSLAPVSRQLAVELTSSESSSSRESTVGHRQMTSSTIQRNTTAGGNTALVSRHLDESTVDGDSDSDEGDDDSSGSHERQVRHYCIVA